ncbi:MAG: efflux RND transporter permease subunit [Sandaracinaceae bacterium]|nr:efflux RND transporter permease subunit [Sandaracinaceae bacterium]
MLDSIIQFAVRWRFLVIIGSVVVSAVGVLALKRLPIDAVPDVTNVQVQVLTESPGLSAEEVERFVTFPVETGLNGLPRLRELRSVTRQGLSAVTVVFDDDVDVWFARQLVAERLREIESDIPPDFGRPQLAPVSTGLGEIYQFVLRSDRRSAMELRTLLTWELGPALRQVPGVIEVNSFGGAAKEYQVIIDPRALSSFRITLPQVLDALASSNSNVGGGYVERGPEQLVIRGEGQLRTTDDIADVVVATDSDGTPIQIRRLGTVQIGATLPQGVVTRDGEGEAVTGIIMMLLGQNSREVVHRVHAKIEELRATLPSDVHLDVVYDRAEFINRTLDTVAFNLVKGALLVVFVILIFLGSWRASLIVALGIPISMLIAVFGMLKLGVTGNLMSLGAIDFGLLVDGPIVMAEAIMAKFAMGTSGPHPATSVRQAIQGVARPVVFSVGIILLVYLPLLALEGTEGKMFKPMAITMALALAGSLIFALVMFPALAATFLRPKPGGHGKIWHRIESGYERWVTLAIKRRVPLLLAAIAAFVLVVPVAMGLGADFVPRIDEGDFIIAIRRIPSIGLAEARRLDLEVEKVLKEFPEVDTALAMTGRAEVATDPVGLDNTDVLVTLRPRAQWRTAHTSDDLAEIMKERIERRVPSTFVSVSQPIEDRTNELIAGSRADVAILLFGEDLARMSDIARNIARVVRRVAGTGDVRVERALGLPTLQVRPDRGRMSRYGVGTDAVLATVEAARMGSRVGVVFEGQKRFDLRVMLPPSSSALESFAQLPVGIHTGEMIPLGHFATITEEESPVQISRQDLHRRLRVEINIRGRDLVSYVNDARAQVESQVALPDGYTLRWGGTFQNLERAAGRLMVVVPMALVIIFGMLFFMFGEVRSALAVFSGVPFALIGGVLALAVRGMPFSIPAAVGFIALCGIAVLNGVVMASETRKQLEQSTELDGALIRGASRVLRALLLTSMVAAFGFLPMAFATSAGSEVQQPLATVVIGGVLSSTLLGLFLLPGLLRIFLQKEQADAIPDVVE